MGRTDTELVAASRNGDASAFGQIVERYQRAVCAVSYSGTGDRTLSEDIAQDTFVTAWRQLGALREIERLPAWLCGIARNLARAARKKRGREAPLEDRDIAADATPFDAISEREAETVIGAALAKLPDTYREPMVLFYCEHQSVAAVARALGISEDATHQRLSRGRQQLAAGVTGLVERTLEGRRPRRDLAAAVLAGIAALGIGSSQVEASTTKATKGTSMMKAGIAAALAIAIGGAAYVATRSHAEPAPAPGDVTQELGARHPASHPTRTPPPAMPAWLAQLHDAPAHATTGIAPPAADAGCAAIAVHVADLALEAQPDAATMTTEQLAQLAAPITEHVQLACTSMHWPEAYIACVGKADSMFGIAVGCKDLQPADLPVAQHGFTSIPESSTPVAPYTGTDVSCRSVAKHATLFSLPDHAALAKLPDDKRIQIETAIANMQKSMPDQLEATCDQDAWPEAKRRCLLAATTIAAAHKCM